MRTLAPVELTRSLRWIAAAAVIAVIFIALVGPGVRITMR